MTKVLSFSQLLELLLFAWNASQKQFLGMKKHCCITIEDAHVRLQNLL